MVSPFRTDLLHVTGPLMNELDPDNPRALNAIVKRNREAREGMAAGMDNLKKVLRHTIAIQLPATAEQSTHRDSMPYLRD